MRLVRFIRDGAVRLGAQLDEQQVVDLQSIDPGLPADMITLFETDGIARAAQALTRATAESTFSRAQVTLTAPIPRPGKIICIGLNYLEHAAESNVVAPDYPTVFAKYANTIIGAGEPIVLPRNSTQVDYEGELGVVIGRQARHVSEADALSYVAGYVPFNDVSARDFQHRTSQWSIGKTFDTFGPLGPAVVTTDEVPDPQRLRLRVSIGDDVLQDANTSEMIFSIAHLVSYLSDVMTLEPGDVIATGTPSGVGAARVPQRFLHAGETVRVEIEGVGVLENPVVAEA